MEAIILEKRHFVKKLVNYLDVICLCTTFLLGGVLLAADYSQLELRIIAHLSRDRKLIKILNDGGDVFKTIASQWRGVPAEDVTATQRQQAKQVNSLVL